MTSQELQGMLAILENYDGNNASSFVTVAQRLWGLFDMIEERYNRDIPTPLLSIVDALQGKLTAIEDNMSCCELREEHVDDDSSLDDPEPIVAPFESHAEFKEDEVEDLNTQECSLVPPISEDKNFQEDEKSQEEEPQVNQVEVNEQMISSVPILVEASSFPITTMVQEPLDQIPLQQEEQLLVQPEDDVPYTLPIVQQPDLVFQGPEIHQSLDIRVHHDPV
jgi:hypothetical protein